MKSTKDNTLLKKISKSFSEGLSFGAVSSGVLATIFYELVVKPFFSWIESIKSSLPGFLQVTIDFIKTYFHVIEVLVFFLLIGSIIGLMRNIFNLKSRLNQFRSEMVDILGDDLKAKICYNKFSDFRLSVKDCKHDENNEVILILHNDIGPDQNEIPFSLEYTIEMEKKALKINGTCKRKSPWVILPDQKSGPEVLLQYEDLEEDIIVKFKEPVNNPGDLLGDINNKLTKLAAKYND